jgi:CDP-glucose 4,6-dehydratase
VERRQGALEDLVMANFWFGRPVLITGASGLVGAALTRLLVEARAPVVCLIRDWVPQSELVRSGLLERVRVVRGDIVDQALMERVLGEYEIDTLFHLAAQTIVSIANRNPVATLDANIRGTWSVLEAARRSPQCKQIVVASSDKAYGSQQKLPYSEETPLEGRHPYDASKSCADLIAQMYAVTYKLPVCVTRCGNFYGPGDLNWNRIVPGTMRSALLGERPIVRSDGKFVRDYLYVDDGAAAYMDTAEKLAERRELAGEAFNFSNEEPQTVLALVERVLAVMERKDLEPEVRNEASNEIREQYLAAGKARRLLGWKPRFTLDEGLQRTAAWYRKQLDDGAL